MSMSNLSLGTVTIPTAPLGPDNPLPPLVYGQDLHAGVITGPEVPEEIANGIEYGKVSSILPYTIQDEYGRCRAPMQHSVATLENGALRATFLLGHGGRLWSLVYLPTGRELLHRNPVLQPANLALRNAWFAGGVEWDIGTIGHSPLTYSPLFAARVQGPAGEPALRMWEWERLRGATFQIDAWMPQGRPTLMVHVRIRNPHSRAIPMYWWSNAAVPETEDVRVLAPGSSAYKFDYGEHLIVEPVPAFDGVDRTYPSRSKEPVDYFFDLPEGVRPWIAALDGSGFGLAQTSTLRMRGRKLFLWGTGPSGDRWQEWLSGPGARYFEIQAGLARTQLEHVRMPAGSFWSWVEAYGWIETDPSVTHGEDWEHAKASVAEAIERSIPAVELDLALSDAAAWTRREPDELLGYGSGWGALENRRRSVADEPPIDPAGMIFPEETLSTGQRPWLALLSESRFPSGEAIEPPTGYLVQQEWRELLERAVATGTARGWAAQLHLGLMRFHAGEHDGARRAWTRSLTERPNAWALRNLAVLDNIKSNAREAARRYEEALALAPGTRPLVVEAAWTLLSAGHPKDCLSLIEAQDTNLRGHGRVRLLEAQAALALGDLDRVERIVFDLTVEDLREGETVLEDLWFDFVEAKFAPPGISVDDATRNRLFAEHPLPASLDFRILPR
jgi:tetratricopeptide (TPR) repeat protein